MSKLANKSNNICLLDKIFGIRALGIVLYGAMSSIFFLLWNLEVEKYQINENAHFFIMMLIFAVITFIVLLIRYRLKGFYLTTEYLTIRSIMITTITLSISTVIFELSGVLQGKYVFVIPHNWNESLDLLKSGSSYEPFLLAVTSLFMASPLFIIVITKKVDLPALPPSNFIKLIIEIQGDIKLLKNNPIWKEDVSMEDDQLIDLANKIEKSLDSAINIKINFNLQKSLKPIHDDMINFSDMLKNLKYTANEGLKKTIWEIYFANTISLSPEQKMHRERKNEICKSINRIKGLKLED